MLGLAVTNRLTRLWPALTNTAAFQFPCQLRGQEQLVLPLQVLKRSQFIYFI